jgi:hypothetical protein
MISLIFLISADCEKLGITQDDEEIQAGINFTVDGDSVKADSILAVYSDSLKVMALAASGRNFQLIIIFSFNTDVTSKTYDVSKEPPELAAVLLEGNLTYSTTIYDSASATFKPIGTGQLTVKSHMAQFNQIMGTFNLTPKEINTKTGEVGTNTRNIKGSFNMIYIKLKTLPFKPPIELPMEKFDHIPLF